MNIILLLFYIITLLLYFPLNRQPSHFHFKSIIDSHLPLIPQSVWVYVSYYVLQSLTIITLWSTAIFTTTMFILIISTLLSSFIWWLFPNGVQRPILQSTQTLSSKLLSHIYLKDQDSNGFPSSHISHSIICCYFLTCTFPKLSVPIYIWCVAICISTLTTKQHYLFDYILTAPLTILLINFLHFIP